jgi:fatty-acyl-CoA synthase
MDDQVEPLKSYHHRGGETALLGATIPEHFSRIAGRFPQREAIVSVHQGRRLSYAELACDSDRLARGLLAFGFGKGDRIGIWSTNNLEWLLLQLAAARIGVIMVNINPAYRVPELAYALAKSEVQGLFVIPAFRSSDYVAMLVELLPELCRADGLPGTKFPKLRQVVIYDTSQPGDTAHPYPGFTIWQEVLQAGEFVGEEKLRQVSASLDVDEVINIQYTSGTTGQPKAVELTHHNLLNNAWFSAQALHFTEHDRLCVPVPFYHCFGMVLGNLLCLSMGACIVLPSEHFDPLAVLQAIQAERCTALHGVPTMFIAELEQPRFADFDLTSLRTGIMAGAPCPSTLMRQVMEEMNCAEILIGYGETEASPLTHLTSRDDSFDRRITTVGINLPHQEVKVVCLQNGHTLPCGEVGEICFRGYHVMRGYHGDPEATGKTIDAAGWLHSGDLGTMDNQGYLRITGRLKDMIIRGGEKIYPAEIEEFLYTLPKIAQVAVFGVPDHYYGEELMAWVRPKRGECVSAEEIRAYCHDRIAHFKIPRHIWFVEEFPTTVTGKLQKFRMREIAIDRMKQ